MLLQSPPYICSEAGGCEAFVDLFSANEYSPQTVSSETVVVIAAVFFPDPFAVLSIKKLHLMTQSSH